MKFKLPRWPKTKIWFCLIEIAHLTTLLEGLWMNLIVAQRKKGKIILDKFYEHAKKGSFFGLPSPPLPPPLSCLSLGPADDRLYYSWKWHTQV